MGIRRFLLVTAAVAAVSPVPALAACTIGRIAELPVTMAGMKALVPAKINGADAQFVVDSGAFFSTLTPASAAEFKLHLSPAPYDLHVQGLGGSYQASVATVDVFTLAGAHLRDLQFVVGGADVGGGAAGVLGQNILRIADTEYDFANGVVRLWRARDCGSNTLAYWARSEPFSVVKIDWTTIGSPHIIATGSLNGHDVRVLFDTGSAVSTVTLRAAERAGFDPKGPNVLSSGLLRGVGSQAAKMWVSTFSTFKLGDEEVRNARLAVVDSPILDVDMLLGADFFLSHRIYVAVSQDKLYFTYNGGPIFNLSAPRQASAAGATEPTDAAGFARRGAASAARRDFVDAIADLTRACTLDPKNAQYFYERGEARLGNRQPFLAMEDFDRTLELAPDDVEALVSRAALRLAGHDTAGAGADLDAAERIAAKQADIRLRIAALEIDAGRVEPAVAQFDLWIASHAEDSRKADALNGRCWARALSGRDLRKALSDCNLAIRMRPAADFLDSRALVEQRLGEFSQAIEDYDAALRLRPRGAWLLYARGVAELRAGRTTQGRADIAAAEALQPRIDEVGRNRGLTP